MKKRKKLTPRQKADKKIWNECKRIIRKRYEHDCFTCNAQNLVGCNLHTGHGKPKGALPLRFKYDLRNLRPQCMRCNMFYGGMSDIFIAKLEHDEEGLEFLEEACVLIDGRWEIRPESTLGGVLALEFLLERIEEYKLL